MTYIKKVVMHGFKSFARKTEIPLENSMNVIVGPNGSGKSNITDALCFVLGRLSMKSIRAPNAAGLLFSGNKLYKPSSEAYVELIFDNSVKTFSLDSKEISIKRIVRKNGQSIYKINNEVKTRQELLELLAQGGIDPDGFNIVLQGEIGSLVKATPEERRKILEDVAGISIYENRKHKSLLELEKTEEKLKEANLTLKERNSYLKNLEQQRQEALSYQKLEETIKRCKATILLKSLNEKDKVLENLIMQMQRDQANIEEIKSKIEERTIEIEKLQELINIVTKKIQSTGEQETLYQEISELSAEIAGLKVRKENYENRIKSSQERISDLKEKKDNLSNDIAKIKTASPEIKKQQERQKVLQEKVNILEQQRRRFYLLKSEVSTLESRKSQNEREIIESKKEIQLIEQNISSLFNEIKHAKSISTVRSLKEETKNKINEIQLKINKLEEGILNHERLIAIYETDVKREQKTRDEIIRLDTCTICKQAVTVDHKHKISDESNEKINFATNKLKESNDIMRKNKEHIEGLRRELNNLRIKSNELDIDEIKLESAEEKKERIKRITKFQEEANKDLTALNEKIHKERTELEKLKNVESEYDECRLKIQELSFADLDADSEIAIKNREISRLEVEIKNSIIDVEESEVELSKVSAIQEEKSKALERKKIEEERLYKQNQKLHDEKTSLQDRQKTIETDVIGLRHTIRNFEDKINYQKVQKAEYEAQREAIDNELKTYGQFEAIKDSIDKIRERLQESQFRINKLGAVNMLALEVFEKVQEQVKQIQERVLTIEQEKEKIKEIIDEIDKKKKKTFVKTLESVNTYFTRNFSQLSKKGEVFLELENKVDPFAGGLEILIKVSRGKYFDIRSLSGGERTLVALSLIFAIQEYKPYSFYIFDEIDAALDKRNSELLAALIKQYMTTGQYIIITHNDTLITEATNLYGVSMQENISKVISLKV